MPRRTWALTSRLEIGFGQMQAGRALVEILVEPKADLKLSGPEVGWRTSRQKKSGEKRTGSDLEVFLDRFGLDDIRAIIASAIRT